MMKRPIRKIFGILILLLAAAFIAFPFGKTVWILTTDRGLRSAEPNKFAYDLHSSLSRRLPGYVDRRIKSGVAGTLSVTQITATESPVYGAFFYLLATENLQTEWEKNPALSKREPKEVGAAAIESSVRIILDRGHAHFVRTYWGDDYLGDPNCFFRTLVIGSLSAHHKLTGKTEHLPLLNDLLDDLATDIDASPTGLIDDYPGQCFPCDVVACIAMIQRADPSREAWAKAAFLRLTQTHLGNLPPYMADADTGLPQGPSRGCTNGYYFSFAREIEPETAEVLYRKWVEDFWQEGHWAAGWREFSRRSAHPERYIDPDSGPVLWGYGTGATGLGIGATRLHSDHYRAGILGAEMIAGSIPMIDGSLLLPRLVSDTEHAPHFAELVILHQLSLSSNSPAPAKLPRLTRAVWLILGVEAFLLILLCWIARRLLRKK